MGIFKKKNIESDIERFMNAPEIPDEEIAWMKKNRMNPSKSKVLRSCSKIFANSWINVETAGIFISNFIPKECAICESEKPCTKCGRTKNAFLTTMTANQDADWLVWNLIKNQEYDDGLKLDGLFVLFDADAYPTIKDKNSTLSFGSQDMVPMELGVIKVKPFEKEDFGYIFVADKVATVDSDYFIASARVPIGNYRVVVWMGYTNIGDLAPMALGVFGEVFNDDLNHDLGASADIPSEVTSSIAGGDGTYVLARFGNNQDHYSEINASFYDLDDRLERFIGQSWGWQRNIEKNYKGTYKAIMKKNYTAATKLEIIDALRIRGKQEISLKLVDEVEAMHKADLNDAEKDIIKWMRIFPPGWLIQILE